MDENLSLWFVSQLVLAVEQCHRLGIVHRDLKAENVLVAKDGTIRLADFGTAVDMTAKHLKVAGTRSGRGKKFENYVGTAQFLAPEALKDQCFGFPTDLWSLGCTIYQIIAGQLSKLIKPGFLLMTAGISPFCATTDFHTYLLIKNSIFEFPRNFPPAAQDLVKNLLVQDPNQRIGVQSLNENKGLEDIKKHPYFDNVNFDDLTSIISHRHSTYPPLRDSCVQHMSAHWVLYRQKWIEHGWLTQDGSLAYFLDESVSDSTPEKPHSQNEEALADSDTQASMWEACEKPTDIDRKARLLLDLQYGRKSPDVYKAKERLLYNKAMLDQTGPRDEAFWKNLTDQFIANG